MKKVLKNSLILVAVFTTFLSFGNDFPPLAKKRAVKETYVTFKDVKKGATLTLKDNDNEVIYLEKILLSGTYEKKFDLSLLPSGEYYFELEKDIEIKTKPFTVTFQEVTFHDKEESQFHKPIVRIEDEKVFISQLSLKKHPLKIELYYDGNGKNNELVYSEKLSNDIILERILKLSKNEKGNYKLVMYSEGHEYIEKFSL